VCTALSLSAAGAFAAAPPKPVVRSASQADSLLGTPFHAARDKAIADWAKSAHADDLAWLMRRPAGALGAIEVTLLDAAIARTSAERTERRQRWLARRAVVATRPLKKGEAPLPALAALRPDASVFTVGSLLPDSGEYAGYTHAVRAALAAGLRHGRSARRHALTLDTLGTGDSDPARLSDGFGRLAPRCDVIVGELLSVPTMSLATAANARGMVVVSPTATDERIGDMGPRVFAVGPSQRDRARALADAVIGREPAAVAIIGSSTAVRGAFAGAFASEVTARGGRIVRREPVRASATESANQAQLLQSSGATVLFWDGPARDAETLLRALATQGASLRMCGGPALAPEGMRPAARPLLEGVAWVAEDWVLPEPERAYVDSIGRASGNRPGSLWTRGYLAGRTIAAAIDRGARTPGEVADLLRGNAAPGTLDPTITGTTLPVYVVRSGRVVEFARQQSPGSN
jgi:ABC-type branched-subunit amino acid transport system substrate-binding protein